MVVLQSRVLKVVVLKVVVLKVVWKKIRLYRRFELDIWGRRILNAMGRTKAGKMFNAWDVERLEYKRQRRMRHVYRIDLDQPLRIRKRQKWGFATRRLSRLFYLTLNYAQFKQLAATASKREGSWESSFIMLVENRLLGMLYRMQINMNVFELRWFVLLGNAFINNRKVTYYNSAVEYFEILHFKERTADFLRAEIIERLKSGSTYFGIPRYMFISYKHMFSFVFKEPKRKDLAFPVKAVDVYRGADYY